MNLAYRYAIIANSIACIGLSIVMFILITQGHNSFTDIICGSVLATCIGLSVSNIIDMSYRHKRDNE